MQYWHLTAHFIIMDWPTPYRIIIMSQRPKVIRKIEDVRVKQIYENSNAFEMGKTTIEYDDEGASLLINSNEQMLSEKLRSLIKFGTFSTRFKDIYELCFTV